jgi:UDP-2-acetamido-2,6-beta-L-arabino-hexul-4-ose reductase
MKTVLITGARGFLARHVALRLETRDDIRVLAYTRDNSAAELAAWAAEADVVLHLAGVNRTESDDEYEAGNAGFTQTLLDAIEAGGRTPHVIVSSSVQAAADNPYGRSKRAAEALLARYAERTGSRVTIYRLKNLFGKWSRPNYNSVVATFCHNAAHGEEMFIRDPDYAVDLVYVDDAVDALVAAIDEPPPTAADRLVDDTMPSRRITLGELADAVGRMREMQQTLRVPDFSDAFVRQLYATYLSHLPPDRWEYGLKRHADQRGDLAEFIKSDSFGQIFISRTHPGITRGDHWHHTKTEKFLVLTGHGLIRFRHIDGGDVLEFPVRGEDYRVVEIPPGWTHSITNIGDTGMVTLFWASEIFDPERPDTNFLPVEPAATTPGADET